MGLGAVERKLGILHQHGRLETIRRSDGDAHAAAGKDVLAVEVHRREQRIDDDVGEFFGLFAFDIAFQDGELVSTQTGEEG